MTIQVRDFVFFFSFFEEMVDRFGVQHIKTAIHSPQSNAAMRVNRNVLAIQSFLDKDHREWDTHLSRNEVAIRNTVSLRISNVLHCIRPPLAR